LSKRRILRPRAEATEAGLLAWISEQPETGGLLGDDAAVLARSGRLVVTVDQQIAGVHFPPDLDPGTVARRLLAVNLSDVAAMGARPTHAFLALAAPADFRHRSFFDAMLKACRRQGVLLAGGDLAAAPLLVASMTLVASPWPGSRRLLHREGARAGDGIWIGGPLGLSRLGRELVSRGARPRGRSVQLPSRPRLTPALQREARRAVRRHLQPRPQLDLGKDLAAAAASRRRSATTDVSDGLVRDLSHLCQANGLGAVIHEPALRRVGPPPRLAEALDLDPLQAALAGGEDYVLLFSLPPDREPKAEWRCRRLGLFDNGEAVRIERADGAVEPAPDDGWDHLTQGNRS
jgi:thiamine-monophosphate kinase